MYLFDICRANAGFGIKDKTAQNRVGRQWQAAEGVKRLNLRQRARRRIQVAARKIEST